MRRYQKWLSVGLLALTPGVTLAGPFSGLGKKEKAAIPAAAASPTKRDAGANQNQETANKIKQALTKARLSGYEIEIVVDKGVATLSGMVTSPEQKLQATKAAGAAVKGLKVNNRLVVAEPPARGSVQQAVASRPNGARPQRARQVQYEGQEPLQVEGDGPIQPQLVPGATPVYSPNPGPIGGPMGGGMGPGMGGGMGGPMAGGPTPGGSNMMYNQPNNPNYAWPSYAQYPNYSAVTYPTQYSASAWPYIGPFYPYPQVPLGWRKATLEWDDGNWNLSFSPRTDRWWWFLDWRNW